MQGYLLNIVVTEALVLSTLKPRQNRCHFTDDIYKTIFASEWKLLYRLSMAWCQKGPNSLNESMMVKLHEAHIHHLASMS